MLITPETSEERIRLIDDHTDGFIYMVSSAAITGAQKDFNAQKLAYFERIAAMNLRNPRMIGFGISNKQTYESAASHAAGAIIGSKFVTLLEEFDGNAEKAIDSLLDALKH
jgi:tryptophan synthase alpha chain